MNSSLSITSLLSWQREGSSVQLLLNAWPADSNAWITKLTDKSCCLLPLPLLKLPMIKFFLAVMEFQAGETFNQRWAWRSVSNAQYIMYQRSFGLGGNVHATFRCSVEHLSRCHIHHISSIINHCIVAIILVVCIIPYVDTSMCVSALSSLLPYNKTTLPAVSPSPRDGDGHSS